MKMFLLSCLTNLKLFYLLTQRVQEDMSSVSTSGTCTYQYGRTLPKRTRSPTITSPSGGFVQNPSSASDGHKRYEREFSFSFFNENSREMEFYLDAVLSGFWSD